ncbi:unnamed protein product [Paramecium primaurelia]|uniref:Uncharacterized protein n=1 Tax=Paramecium primaurelia TaxID=5886 RepID=A0A8S1PR21_PARPR|nr:unnamed protein product [Paramecium primaurelia]
MQILLLNTLENLELNKQTSNHFQMSSRNSKYLKQPNWLILDTYYFLRTMITAFRSLLEAGYQRGTFPQKLDYNFEHPKQSLIDQYLCLRLRKT